jgi:hypothetical protein
LEKALACSDPDLDFLVRATIRELLQGREMVLNNLKKLPPGRRKLKPSPLPDEKLGFKIFLQLFELPAELTLAGWVIGNRIADASGRRYLAKCSQPLQRQAGFGKEAVHIGVFIPD